jgi:hypothetical protein
MEHIFFIFYIQTKGYIRLFHSPLICLENPKSHFFLGQSEYVLLGFLLIPIRIIDMHVLTSMDLIAKLHLFRTLIVDFSFTL